MDMNAALQELEFLMESDASMEEFTSVYSEILDHAKTSGDYTLLREARALLIKQMLYLAGRYREEAPPELLRILNAQQN